MVEHDREIRQRGGELRCGEQVPRPCIRHVQDQAALSDRGERTTHLGQLQQVVPRVVVDQLPHPAEDPVALPPVQLALDDGRRVELDPADDTGDPLVPLRDGK